MSLRQFVHPLATVDAHDSVERAACIMRDRGVGCLLITSEGRPRGIVTDRDLALRVLADGVEAATPVGELATIGPFTVSVNDTVETASLRMRDHGVRRMPIIDEEGKAIGIVTADDLLMALGRQLAEVTGAIENRADSTDTR
jgi:CBS domain-containing protein